MLALSAAVTGQTVVKTSMVSVTTISTVDSEARAGQLVTEAAHDVIVWTEVAKTVRVVCAPVALVLVLYFS